MNKQEEKVRARLEEHMDVGMSVFGMECRMGLLIRHLQTYVSSLNEKQKEEIDISLLINHFDMRHKFYYLLGIYLERVIIHEDFSNKKQIIDSIIETGHAILNDNVTVKFPEDKDIPQIINDALKELDLTAVIKLMLLAFEEGNDIDVLMNYEVAFG